MTKSVCIIGAGPSGIIAAKTLTHNFPKGTFRVTVFEQADRIGGLWPLSAEDEHSLINPQMCTNGSRHIVSFSDLAWPETAPAFPKAWQVGQYLMRYVDRYPFDLRLSHRVVKATRSLSTSETSKRWQVSVQQVNAQSSSTSQAAASTHLPSNLPNGDRSETSSNPLESLYFDHLIVGSGFFGEPKIPEDFEAAASTTIPVQHSLLFRDVNKLLGTTKAAKPDSGGNILVVGGSFSGAETSAAIASQISSEVYSPGVSQLKNADKYRVHHVVTKPIWCAPLFLTSRIFLESEDEESQVQDRSLQVIQTYNPAPPFLPMGFIMFDLTRRKGELRDQAGRIRPEHAKPKNAYFAKVLSDDQLWESPRDDVKADSLQVREEAYGEATWLGLSELYNSFVRSGDITTSVGRLTSIRKNNGESTLPSAVTIQDGKEKIIDNVAAVIFATGFDSSSSLKFLEPHILQTLGHDPACEPFPLDLNVFSTVHPDLSDLGFVGYYRGPFWAVMEMQSRYLGKLWSGDERAATALANDGFPIRDLRKCYMETPSQMSQFPCDYVYAVETFKDILGMKRTGLLDKDEVRSGPVLPARYTLPEISLEARQESEIALSIARSVLIDSAEKGKFVARGAFRGLHGKWRVSRDLISSSSTYPSGSFRGEARFHPRAPEVDSGFDTEYLYIEEGDFETETGLKFRASRRYAYRYKEVTDTLSAWFIKPSDNLSVDYLFHELEILPPIVKTNGESSGWRARSSHLCVADTYDVEYEFRFKGPALSAWSLKYAVRGPKKDYRIESTYVRE